MNPIAVAALAFGLVGCAAVPTHAAPPALTDKDVATYVELLVTYTAGVVSNVELLPGHGTQAECHTHRTAIRPQVDASLDAGQSATIECVPIMAAP